MVTTGSPRQLTLGISPHDEARLENFYVAAQHQLALDYLTKLDFQTASPLVYLWGGQGSGRSHLLQAMCHQANDFGHTAIYIPLSQKLEYHPEIFEGIAQLSLVCVDDISQIAGDSQWELALFHAYNRCYDNQVQLMVAADSAPSQLRLQLADLRSRLSSGIVFQLDSLDDAQKLELLMLRADKRGIKLTDKVARFILYRADRSSSGLIEVLSELDRITLEEKRRLTIPLIKESLGW